jgi:polyhydroxyalkanoate synthase subunit PhaC
MRNALTTPGAVSMLGTPVDLSAITADSYVIGGGADHISPWQACYRSAQLLGSKDYRFVLSTSGHIAAIVNPPGNEKASYRVARGDDHAEPRAWLRSADMHPGSWWDDWNAWLAERSGPMRPAPKRLGNREFKPRGRAPGTYVLAA